MHIKLTSLQLLGRQIAGTLLPTQMWEGNNQPRTSQQNPVLREITPGKGSRTGILNILCNTESSGGGSWLLFTNVVLESSAGANCAALGQMRANTKISELCWEPVMDHAQIPLAVGL